MAHPRVVCGTRGSRARCRWAKAMEGVFGPGEALLDPGLRAREAGLPITGTGKWQVVERDSEGVVVVVTVGTTQPGSSEGPLLHRCTTKEWRDSDECRAIG